VKLSYERREHMKYTLLIGALLLTVVLASACGPAPVVTGVPTQLEPLASAVVATATGLANPPATTTPEASASPVVANTQAATATSEVSIPVTGDTTVRASLSDSYGPILVDGDGAAVYMFKNDTQNGDTSACSDEECTAEWTPVTTQGSPVAGAGVIQNMLGTITRADGTMQVTYNGWPLYYSTSGSTGEQGDEGTWFLVTPSGTAVAE
jgi:predicted lipoprotein with Yx(FWY)xxD motif